MSQINTRIILRNDSTANWNVNSDQVLLKGEVGIEFTESGKVKVKIGDGVKTWAELSYFGGNSESQVFEVIPNTDEAHGDAIARVTTGTELENGAIAIVKTLIAGDKYEHTAYIYDGTWKAMDGNYNAKNVYFDSDLLTTSAVGNITLTNGQATIAAQGKNLKQVFDTIFVKESNPTITQPSVSVTSTQAKAYEVGTKVTPSWDATFNAGKYQFGPATAVAVTSWEISNTDGNTASTEDGSFPEITVEDNTNYTITAKANYTDGAIPVTNVGNEYAVGQIKSGSKSATTSTKVIGYRNTFYGTLTEKTAIDSTVVRGLTASNKALANGSTFQVTIPVGALRVVIAYPATLQDISSIADVNGMSAEIKSSFTKSTVSVEGANGYTAAEYKVYTMDFANANDTANTFAVKI